MRKFGIVGASVLGAIVLAGCSVSTNPDQSGLVYDAGEFSSTKFQECVSPSNRAYYGPGDIGYVYPAGVRTYTFDEGGDRSVIDIADKDGQPLTVAGILTFTMNTECDTLQEFHERIGLKYGASGDDIPAEWSPLLNDYLGQPLRSAMRDASGEYTWRELYSDPAKRTEWEGKVKELLPQYIRDLAGGDYFINPTLNVQVPRPGDALLRQIEEQNTQVERLNTIEAQKAAQQAEIDQMRQLVDMMGPQGYILYRQQVACENGGNCPQFVPIPQGGNINVTPGN